ncbi:MAG: flagellar biosynthetic protein FliQ [Pseudomonadota bacterium]
MAEDILFDLMRRGLWVSFLISTPILTVALLTGIVIGLLQALTSIQEMTLTFVPKMAAIALVFWSSMNMMSEAIVDLFSNELIPVIVSV